MGSSSNTKPPKRTRKSAPPASNTSETPIFPSLTEVKPPEFNPIPLTFTSSCSNLDFGWNSVQDAATKLIASAPLASIQKRVEATNQLVVGLNGKLDNLCNVESRFEHERLRTRQMENDEYEKVLRENVRTKQIMNDQMELQMYNDQRELRQNEAKLKHEANQIELLHRKRQFEAEDEALRKRLQLEVDVRKNQEIDVYVDNEAHRREMEKMKLSAACQVQLLQATSSSNVNAAIMNRRNSFTVNAPQDDCNYDEDNAEYA